MYIYTYTYTYVCVCVCVCIMYNCIYIFILYPYLQKVGRLNVNIQYIATVITLFLSNHSLRA